MTTNDRILRTHSPLHHCLADKLGYNAVERQLIVPVGGNHAIIYLAGSLDRHIMIAVA